MSVLSHFPSFFSLGSNKPFAAPLPSSKAGHSIHHFCHLTHRHPAILASSIKKPRKSNADLCRDIREFVSAARLPEDHVPSLKELSQHGRQDLANIVRRRGYKLVKDLLETSAKSDKKESDTEPGLSRNQDLSVECEYDSAGLDKEVEEMDDVFSSSEVSAKQNYLNSANGANMDCAVNSDSNGCKAIESSTNSSLHEKVEKFIQNGELDPIEEDGFGILHEIGADSGNEFVELENVKNECSSLSEERSDWVLHRGDTAKIINGSILSPKQVVFPVSGTNTPREYNLSGGGLGAGCDEELDDQTIKRENQIEVNRLKFMLDQKELELSRLKEQIDKEKLALSILQTKVETEISKAQKLVMEKDAELHATEGNLAGLVEVEIQYEGDGDAVEVTGSFNGWHHRIAMDPQPSSSITDPKSSRKSRLWTTALWLYPGIYEIKFVVDGNWRIDPQRESVTKGTIENNILRVDR
ncbi:protein PTST homolog 3, chloroplastic [Rhododendron vialii]|uniref:protein PTST homolog 3, chloroplastic n=1 Tax=Rhododendron vialii TaxID=182163 RepID=UPI00265DCE3B|nr:protein PTST homolog 3, chloroplastic [Rhododendron vialii]XP_058212784.1 protein PTST homolog 3, chloroplastic [Rhododendron vialii]XP_058212785.1 protein PTST homolog 3, chloroplastic [Rhododendron vialii]